MAKRAKTLSQYQMYHIWDTMEDILMFVEGGEYELPYIKPDWIGKGQPTEELRFWSDLLNKEYITEETKYRERNDSINVSRHQDKNDEAVGFRD